MIQWIIGKGKVTMIYLKSLIFFVYLGGDFKYLLFSALFGEDSHFD